MTTKTKRKPQDVENASQRTARVVVGVSDPYAYTTSTMPNQLNETRQAQRVKAECTTEKETKIKVKTNKSKN
jgi:hypothetical protein